MLLFISKYCFLLAKSLPLFSFLSFLCLFFVWNLYIVSFGIFVNENYIKDLISNFTLCSTFYIIDLLIITYHFVWNI